MRWRYVIGVLVRHNEAIQDPSVDAGGESHDRGEGRVIHRHCSTCSSCWMVSTGNTGLTTHEVPSQPVARTRRKHLDSHPKLITCALCRPGYNWWSEALHGVARESIATSFPQICGLATSFNTSLFHAVGSAIGLEVSMIFWKVDGASWKAERRCGTETGFARCLLLPSVLLC